MHTVLTLSALCSYSPHGLMVRAVSDDEQFLSSIHFNGQHLETTIEKPKEALF